MDDTKEPEVLGYRMNKADGEFHGFHRDRPYWHYLGDPEEYKVIELIDRTAYTAVAAQRDQLREALLTNHYWHQKYDDHGGYAGSELEQINVAALAQQVKPS